MERSQWYLGTPNGIVLCVDQAEADHISGSYYHSYSKEAVMFSSMDEALAGMEQLFDTLNFPYPATCTRTFGERKHRAGYEHERTKMMKDEELLNMHGDLGTFIIRVQHRQNSSWQGRITWMEENKTVYFRSIWEMIKLMAGALDTVSVQEGRPIEPEWPKDEDNQEKEKNSL